MTPQLNYIAMSLALGAALSLCACGDDDGATGGEDSEAGRRGDNTGEDPFGNAGSVGGSTGSGARAGSGGSAGSGAADAGAPDAATSDAGDDASAPDAGESGDGGSSSDGGGTPGGPMGTQPIGTLCANDGNCSQEMGEAVCCVDTCELVQDCPESPGYLPCDSRSDCEAYGGGKICCELGPQRFCTKQSACGGEIIP